MLQPMAIGAIGGLATEAVVALFFMLLRTDRAAGCGSGKRLIFDL